MLGGNGKRKKKKEKKKGKGGSNNGMRGGGWKGGKGVYRSPKIPKKCWEFVFFF